MKGTATIRKATEADLESLSSLICNNAEKLLRPHYSAEQWRVFIKYYSANALLEKLSRQSIFCAESNGQIIGTVALEGDFVVGFYTHINYLKQGVGTMLMDYLEQYALQHDIKQIRLAASPEGVVYYNKHGWRKIKVTIFVYEGVDFEETLMTKDLM